MYNFTDKNGRNLALRPELTASTMRFYVNNLQNRPKPQKLYYFGNCFRYERPQKGRFREFWQFGVEFIGSSTSLALAELIAMAVKLMDRSGLRDFQLNIGYLDILRTVMAKIGLPTSALASALVLIDKKNIEGLEDLLYENGTSAKLVSDILSLLDVTGGIELLEEMEGMERDYPELAVPLERFRKICHWLVIMGIDKFNIDLGVVRGLDYYTGMVFEIEAPMLGAEKQICGGGEYSLVPLFGGREVATSGFALGFDRLLLALENQGYVFRAKRLDLFLVPVSPDDIQYTVGVANSLRTAGLRVDLELRGRNVKKAMKYGNSLGAAYVGIIGENERNRSLVAVKDMNSGEQKSVPEADLVSYLWEGRNSLQT
jgi:histidyl-tRNA synthetase